MEAGERLAHARIAVVGLGYVGLPLAVEFGKQYDTVGYDIHAARIAELERGHDSTLEVDADELREASRLRYTTDLQAIRDCNVYIVTVPTPIDEHKRPDFTPLIKASQAIGSVLKPGDLVIYESTVYPGATEEICVPELERTSGLRFEGNTAAHPERSAAGDANSVHPERSAAVTPTPVHPERSAEGAESKGPAASLPPPPAGEGWGGGASSPAASVGAASAATTPTPVHPERSAEGAESKGTFAIGYSPERINPGDKERRLTTIPKVTSGSTPETADFVDALYRSIITAGTHKASSIKVAEASKVIENTQRDANIALVNEFAMIFHRIGIDTSDVLAAAATKWNFLPFKPGLVGGHCIGVDPYYLIQKAQSVGYYPDILMACRRINDAMGQHVAAEVVKLMIRKGQAIAGARVLILGFTFKENCPDLRNTRVIDLVREFEEFGASVDVHDPWADAAEAKHEYGIELLDNEPASRAYDAIVVAVAHEQYAAAGVDGIRSFGKPGAVIYDIKGILPKADVDARL